jgi:(p)ppGpp synthase/HD superfamily hydrolase
MHSSDGVIVEGIDNCPIKFAKCCSPLPGDEIIGFVGSSGYSTGPHVHFEVFVDGQNVDPMYMLKIGQRLNK